MTKNISVICLAAVLLSACDTLDKVIVQPWVKPRPFGLSEVDKDETPAFKRGWADGCDTGLASYGNDRYKMAYGWVQDINMIDNDDYMQAWNVAYHYCRRYNSPMQQPWLFGGKG